MRTVLTPLAVAALALAASAQSYPWTTVGVANPPSARERVGGATDGTVLFLYGGQVSTTTSGFDNLLSFDGTDWTELTASGASCGPRTNPAMAWDTARGKLVVFGGKGANGIWDDRAQDTWEWDPSNGWIQMAPTTVPDARWFANAVYVPGTGVVFHGGNAVDGAGAQYTDDRTWAWDGTDWSVIATGPEKQNYTMVHRPAANDLVLFGGNSQALADKSAETWRLDLTTLTWSQVVTATLPTSSAATGGPGLVGASGYLNPVTGRVVLHGGQGNGGPPSTFTWEFDGVDWTDVSDPGSPAIRNSQGAWLAATGKGYALCGNSGGGAVDWTQEHGPGTVAGSFVVSGAGCAGSTGLTADLSAAAPPQVGQTFVVDMTNTTPVALPVAAVGLSDTTWLLGSLPFSFSVLFPATLAGCDLLVNPELQLGMALAPGTATLSLPIPNNPGLAGATLFVQGLQVELLLPSGDLSIATSPKGTAVIGS